MGRAKRRSQPGDMVGPYGSDVVHLVVRTMLPLIQLFALYVITHGHYSPGGGFQGGAILAATILLMRFVLGGPQSDRKLSRPAALLFGSAGVFLFAGIGVLCLVWGGNYLDYGNLPLPLDSAALVRSQGILAVEIGVALGVTGVLVVIFDNLTAVDAPVPPGSPG